MRSSSVVLPYVISIFALIWMAAMLATVQPDHFYKGTRYDVRVVNGFQNNSSLPLVIWCATKQSDMGGRALQEGDDYSWIVETTPTLKFWDGGSNVMCTMKWDNLRKKFSAFVASRDSRRCWPSRVCLWLVKEDGFYFSSNGFNYFKDFGWSS